METNTKHLWHCPKCGAEREAQQVCDGDGGLKHPNTVMAEGEAPTYDALYRQVLLADAFIDNYQRPLAVGGVTEMAESTVYVFSVTVVMTAPDQSEARLRSEGIARTVAGIRGVVEASSETPIDLAPDNPMAVAALDRAET